MKKIPFPIYLGVLVLLSFPAMAGTLRETQPLAFGRLAITGMTVQSMIMAPDGSETHDAGITPLQPHGHNGVFLLTHYTPSTVLTVSVADTTLDNQGSGTPSFDITTFTFDPPVGSQTTDGAGDMTLKIGATLSTRINTIYIAGPYRGTYTLLLNF